MSRRSPTKRCVFQKIFTLLVEMLRKFVQEGTKVVAKRFWEEIGEKMGKSGQGCERVAKQAKIQVTL